MLITEPGITAMVVIVGAIALGLLILLTVKIYLSEQPKQRASVEVDDDRPNEIT